MSPVFLERTVAADGVPPGGLDETVAGGLRLTVTLPEPGRAALQLGAVCALAALGLLRRTRR